MPIDPWVDMQDSLLCLLTRVTREGQLAVEWIKAIEMVNYMIR